MADSDGNRRDPWPSPQPAWQDPPWLLSGRVLTAWFSVDTDVLRASLSPDLLPLAEAPYRIRLRFYDLAFRALGENPGQSLAPTEGRFRETAVGFPARAGTGDGDMSVFMWADSDTYIMWAREAFGWPLLRGAFQLEGEIWSRPSDLVGASGTSVLTDDWGTATIAQATLTAETPSGSLAARWVTPRRILHRGGLAGDTRELQVVRPEVRSTGTRYGGTGSAEFSFRAPHPLALLDRHEAEIDLVDSFELLVGGDVEVI
jgi:hypothetical protein